MCGAILISEFWDKVREERVGEGAAADGRNRSCSSRAGKRALHGHFHAARSTRRSLRGCARFGRYAARAAEEGWELMIAQVLEETGYDLTDQFPERQLVPGHEQHEGVERRPYYVELVIKEQKIRLYFIPGVHEGTYFETRTRKEISVSLSCSREEARLTVVRESRKLTGSS